ncbi:MAG: transposase [Blautia sp.]|nr:transposase [Blautia sp.]
MEKPTSSLEASWRKRSEEAQERVLSAIKEMQAKGEPINFNTVHLRSGASKNYLYTNEVIRKEIEKIRSIEAYKAGAWHKKYDRTSKSKDVLIEAKDKRIAKLEEENLRLRRELDNLRRLLYETK